MFTSTTSRLLIAALGAVFHLNSSVLAFVVPTTTTKTTTRPFATQLYSDAYTYSYSGGYGNVGPLSASPSDEGRVATLEKALEQRLAALSQKEVDLEARLSSIESGPPSLQGPVGRGSSRSPSTSSEINTSRNIQRIWEASPRTRVQGGSLRTWSFANPFINRVHVLMKTDGRPLDADIDLWQGPDNTPHRMRVYVEDGAMRTFSAFIDTPASPNTVAIRNIGHLEFPLDAVVGTDVSVGDDVKDVIMATKGETVQGGALRTYGFDPSVSSVAILLTTDGRPLNSRIELLQGPNNNKQVIELYTEDGLERPFMAVFQTPGSGNVVRVVNTAPVEFPLISRVAAYEVDSEDRWDMYPDGVILGDTF